MPPAGTPATPTTRPIACSTRPSTLARARTCLSRRPRGSGGSPREPSSDARPLGLPRHVLVVRQRARLLARRRRPLLPPGPADRRLPVVPPGCPDHRRGLGLAPGVALVARPAAGG